MALLFEPSDVLFTWSLDTTTSIPAKMMLNMLYSAIWKKYECGLSEQDTSYHRLAQRCSFPASEAIEAFTQACDSLQPNSAITSCIKKVKKISGGATHIYAMSKIFEGDYEILKTISADLSVFDRDFASSNEGPRKPDPKLYQHILKEAKLEPHEVIFIDGKVENVPAARILGIMGHVSKDDLTVIRALSETLNSPIVKGEEYLRQNIDCFESVTQSGTVVPEHFAQLLILDTLRDSRLVSMEWNGKNTWSFFKGKPTLVPSGYFPDDLDVTSLALTVLKPDSERVTAVLNEMLEYLNPDGSFNVYYDRTKCRVDAVVNANVLACFYTFERGNELEQTLNTIREVLLHRTYMQGTRYYPSPDCCLYFFGRLLRSSEDARLRDRLQSLVQNRVEERIGEAGDALELAMRIITCKSMGLRCEKDRQSLLATQGADGGWEGGWIYRYGTSGIKIGNKGVTTAMAVKALQLTEDEMISGMEQR